MSEFLNVVIGGPDGNPASDIIYRLRKGWRRQYGPRRSGYVHPDKDPLFLSIADSIRKAFLIWPDSPNPIELDFFWDRAGNPETFNFRWSADDRKTWSRLEDVIKAYEAKQRVAGIADRFAIKNAA